MTHLSDVNLRPALVVLVGRAGGSVEISNGELYDAMLPDSGETERFMVAETPRGVRVSLYTWRRNHIEPSGDPPCTGTAGLQTKQG